MGREATPPAGATPAAPPATDGQTAAGGTTTGTPAPSPAPSTSAPAGQPATGTDPEATLGDAGKRAIQSERDARKAADDRAKAAEEELQKLRDASKTESEKALDEAKKAGASEAATKLHSRIRTTEAKSALIAAGADASLVDLAVKADQFQALKVSDDGEVQGLEEAVKAFKTANPAVFAKAPAPAPKPGSADQGARGGQPPERSANLTDALAKRFGATG